MRDRPPFPAGVTSGYLALLNGVPLDDAWMPAPAGGVHVTRFRVFASAEEAWTVLNRLPDVPDRRVLLFTDVTRASARPQPEVCDG